MLGELLLEVVCDIVGAILAPPMQSRGGLRDNPTSMLVVAGGLVTVGGFYTLAVHGAPVVLSIAVMVIGPVLIVLGVRAARG